MASGSDRRIAPRYEVNREFASIDDFVSEYVSNVSGGGIFIRSKHPLPMGTWVNLRFTLLLDEIEVIEGVGEVVHVNHEGQEIGMGVAFRQLTPESRDVIALATGYEWTPEGIRSLHPPDGG